MKNESLQKKSKAQSYQRIQGFKDPGPCLLPPPPPWLKNVQDFFRLRIIISQYKTIFKVRLG